ncbi:GNAT family N-acetyltransferase [Dyella soli]|uniref:GNAT family N-acetyltransferase n=1 Tax=Dyella soli TaxID=522319 RepID=A0A4R0YT66_9GAMM|nr:GNAT family N-acetyltransferase [Dyella soli]TCI09172.1 GNAT family N-acetyltransferase [Dyella soli]
MPDQPDIRVAPVDAALRPALLRLGVHDAQRDFVGDIADLLADAESCPGSEPMAILRGDVPVGYYRLEAQARVVAGRDFEQSTLGLRAFFIDRRWQGRGLGLRALEAVFADLAARHPAAGALALTVNEGNAAGRALYRRAGFEDTGELYHGGRSGPQHLMLRALPA